MVKRLGHKVRNSVTRLREADRDGDVERGDIIDDWLARQLMVKRTRAPVPGADRTRRRNSAETRDTKR
jgi:hypothetical protein